MSLDIPPDDQVPPRRYALWLARVTCWLIDAAVPATIVGIGYFIGQPTFRTETQTASGVTYDVTISSGLQPAYYLCLVAGLAFNLWNKGYREGRTGKSIGKQMLGFTTVRIATGKPLGITWSTARCVLLVVDFGLCYLGVMWPLWDDRRQCLMSDKLTGSVVLRDG